MARPADGYVPGMSTPDGRTPHPVEPAEGAEQPGEDEGGRTQHPVEPAEGPDDGSATDEP